MAGSATISVLASSSDARPQDTRPKFRQHSSTKRGFFSNTYLIEGDLSCALIDAHLNIDEAEDLVGLINTIEKPLETIVITHPHPDHYLGLEHLAPVFPNTVIQSSGPTIEYIRVAASDWSAFSNPMKAFNQGHVTLAGRDFECSLPPDAESVAPVVLFEPESKTLIAGDHVMNQQHHWLVEGRLDAWQKNLEMISNRWSIDRVLPGHGDVGGPELIASTDAYLEDFQSLKEKGFDAAHVRREMLHQYPQHVFIEALDNSILANIQ